MYDSQLIYKLNLYFIEKRFTNYVTKKNNNSTYEHLNHLFISIILGYFRKDYVTIKTVSYTHLDVYKRQDMHIGQTVYTAQRPTAH